ncbi:F-box domain protein [Ancylostoma duodenale]|uniref:F-box domain protein n=1 Tax=Ancylostoma duodenale TaxID=51022 RepID=A0A0C2GJQ2_9BILA|nr:F-box domain protein [Ancylostoma duodenale]
MGKRRYTKTPISGHWAQRFRRMRAYNPRATFEQAQLISKLFEESKKKPKKSVQAKQIENQEMEDSEQNKALNIVDLPDDVLLKIFKYVSSPDPNDPHLRRYLFGGLSKLAIKALYRLRPVCKRFHDIFFKYHSSLPKPSIGLRLQAAVNRDRTYGGSVVAYIYGDCGKRYFSKFVYVQDVPAAIFPGQICTFLVIKSLVITDDLMDMLQSLDLSKVEELFWHDIRGSRVTNLVERMQALLRKMTSLCTAEFYATDDFFDPTTMFPNTDRYWTELGLEKSDEKTLKREEVRAKYRRLEKWSVIRAERSQRRRNQ